MTEVGRRRGLRVILYVGRWLAFIGFAILLFAALSFLQIDVSGGSLLAVLLISGSVAIAVALRWLRRPTTEPQHHSAQTSRRIPIMNFIIINLWIAMIWTHVAIIRAYLKQAPHQIDSEAPAATRPAQGQPESTAVATWKAEIVATMLRNKRYPEEARSRGEEGVVHVYFRFDRQGRLLQRRVVGSSGAASLDEEALALLERAQPFPTPPPDYSGEYADFNVPIRFRLSEERALTPLPPPWYPLPSLTSPHSSRP